MKTTKRLLSEHGTDLSHFMLIAFVMTTMYLSIAPLAV